MTHRSTVDRRRFVGALLGGGACLLAAPWRQALAGVRRRSLSLHNTHTNEKLDIAYFEDGEYVSGALRRLAQYLRDFRNGQVHGFDPALFDQLHTVQSMLGVGGRFEVISGYRSPDTNAMLRRRSSGVAKHSLHLEGRAIDVRLTSVDTAQLRDAALELAAGGVGYYRRSDFVHMDTGRVRRW